MPIGHNDAITWPELRGLFRRRDVEGVRRHLQRLRQHGVTCVRLMLEYAQVRHRYLERPAGIFVPAMVQLWDDLFALCEEVGIHILLTPFDTFFTWRHWRWHPYNLAHGGPCREPGDWLLSAAMRRAIHNRLAFATRRWGSSPALFAWDLWNELHPAHARGRVAACEDFVSDTSEFLRALEIRLHGRAHLQTVSVFGPELLTSPALCDTVFRHPGLDFANIHLYERSTIDDPRDTVAPALAVGRMVRSAMQEVRDQRPVFDSEHGPIHAFIDHHRTLNEDFDDQYFRHMQWAHLASGGAGGGMRWPNRHPHVLTPGMRLSQRSLSRFTAFIDWPRFQRRNLNAEASASGPTAIFACGDAHQAIAWLLRTAPLSARGMVVPDPHAERVEVLLPGLDPGRYQVVAFDTLAGSIARTFRIEHAGGALRFTCPPPATDEALAIARLESMNRT